jgi:hypothetical protein
VNGSTTGLSGTTVGVGVTSSAGPTGVESAGVGMAVAGSIVMVGSVAGPSCANTALMLVRLRQTMITKKMDKVVARYFFINCYSILSGSRFRGQVYVKNYSEDW